MIVLDTNVLSELMRQTPSEAVWRWLHANQREELCATALSVAEIHDGIEQLPLGRRRSQVRLAAADAFAVVQQDLLSFTAEAATAYAEVVRTRRRAGLPIGVVDAQIAAICLVEEAALATRNIRDFVRTGVELVDPWE